MLRALNLIPTFDNGVLQLKMREKQWRSRSRLIREKTLYLLITLDVTGLVATGGIEPPTLGL